MDDADITSRLTTFVVWAPLCARLTVCLPSFPFVAQGQLPEDVGRLCSQFLLEEVAAGGCVDSGHQPLMLTLMALTTEDVSRLRVGKLTAQSIATLRTLKKFLNVK